VTVRLRLSLLRERLAVCRLPAAAALPAWAAAPAAGFSSVTRTARELSLVVPEAVLPEAVVGSGGAVGTLDELRVEPGFRALEVAGPLDFSLVGVLASLTAPLAEAGVSLFAVSTFDTDYVLLREEDLPRAVAALTAAGHRVD
jgi:hypothetical protein